MCGISGYLNFGLPPVQHNATLLRMLDMVVHRGPDDVGMVAVDERQQIVEVSPHFPTKLAAPARLILGFRRLSIVDLSPNGHQPMLSTDGQVALMMNGEIYNAFDYREELIQEGYAFRSTTDTEVVLNLYLKHGFDAMIPMLNGMFGIVLYDARLGLLFLARDRFGIKPLYLLREPGRLAFASEMKVFKALPGFRFELEEAHLDEFLLFRNLIHRTLFKNIVNLTPGTYCSIDLEGNVTEHLYFDLLDNAADPLPADQVESQLEHSLQQAVRRQMMSDVKLGCQLSGGVDSSLVCHYAAQEMPSGQLETISIIFDEPGFSEETYVDYAVNKLQLHAHKFTLDAAYYLEQFDRATWHYEQPLNHPNTIGIYLLSENARRHVTVLLSGEGADEAFAGYDRFAELSRSPWFNRRFLSLIKQNRNRLLPFLNYYRDEHLRLVMASAFGNPGSAEELWPNFNFERANAQRRQLTIRLDPTNIRGMRQYELLTYLPDLLMRQDKMSMAHSIENRVPFLDNELINLALRLPAESLIGKANGQIDTKLALKRLCAAHFSHDFAFRPKMGFGIPLKDFLSRARFQEKWKEELLPGIRQRGLFRTEVLTRSLSNLSQADPNQIEMVWLMSGFENWAQQYLDI